MPQCYDLKVDTRMISLKEDTGDVMQGRVPGLQSEPGSRVKCYKAGRRCTALDPLSRFRSTKVKGKTQNCFGIFCRQLTNTSFMVLKLKLIANLKLIM